MPSTLPCNNHRNKDPLRSAGNNPEDPLLIALATDVTLHEAYDKMTCNVFSKQACDTQDNIDFSPILLQKRRYSPLSQVALHKPMMRV